MEIPELKTERLQLLAPSANSWHAYRQFYTDPEASVAYGGPLSTERAWARLASDIGSWHLLGFGVWVIQRRQQQDIVGACGFWQGKGWPRELTWWLLPIARGSGVATEASLAAIDCAYDRFGWDCVRTYMNDDNQAARALALRLNGKRCARDTFPDGVERDVFILPPTRESTST